MKILTNQTANGTSSAYTYNPFKKNGPAGGPASTVVAVLVTSGTFDGANVTWQISPDQGTTWVTDTTTVTAPGFTQIYMLPGWRIRLVVASVGAGTSITAWLDSESSIVAVS